MKRIIGAIIDGFGHAAGRELFEQAKERVARELEEAERNETSPAAAPSGATRERARKREARAMEKAAREREKALEAELAALKRKLGKR